MVVLLGAMGCADDHGDEASVGADACEHFSAGPIAAIAAGATSAEATAAPEEHTRYDVSLPEAGGGRVGYLEVPIAEAGEHVFFFDSALSLVLTDGQGSPLEAEEVLTSDPDCATIGAGFIFDLEVGTYRLEVSAAAEDALVELVYFGVGADGHDH